MKAVAYFLSILLFSLIIVASAPVQASPGGWMGWFWPFSSGDLTRPYLEDGKTPHNSQWERDPWTPQDWITARGSVKDVLDGLYAAGIIKEQYMDDDVPVLEVGYNFVRLSDREKNRVAKFVDHAFGITAVSEGGMFLIEYDSPIKGGDGYIGLYTRRGLQLQ